jgi:putative ABC transport system permease protein
VEGRPVPAQDQLAESVFNVAQPDYFQTMGIPLIEGRPFQATDTAQTPPVIVINQSMARRWWPNESPLGKRIKQGFPQSKTPYREIVGVVGDVKQDGPDTRQLEEVFYPEAQNTDNAMTMVVRTAGDPLSMAATVEKEIHALDSNLPVARVQPMTQYFSEALARRRFSTLLLGIFGALALVLAAVGIYGVMAYSVAQRTHEIGIRVALGAQRNGILMLVVGQGLRFAFLGVVAGLSGAFVLTRWMASLLFGVTATDPVTFAAVTVVLMSIAVAACYVPARRAMKVDPMVALRYE